MAYAKQRVVHRSNKIGVKLKKLKKLKLKKRRK